MIQREHSRVDQVGHLEPRAADDIKRYIPTDLIELPILQSDPSKVRVGQRSQIVGQEAVGERNAVDRQPRMHDPERWFG
jgi:hypothetical protein